MAFSKKRDLQKPCFAVITTGCAVFLCIVLLVAGLDKAIELILQQGEGNPGRHGITFRHFSWHFDYINSGAFQLFIDRVIGSKIGILGTPLFYESLFFLFLFLSFCLFVSFFFPRRVDSGKNSGDSFIYSVIAWVIVKQLVFIFTIPPWQGPDETYHLFYLTSITPKLEQLKGEILFSLETYNFWELIEQKYYLSYLSYPKEHITRYQPPLYYLTVRFFTQGGGISTLPEIIYAGRFISSLCLAGTLMAASVFFRSREKEGDFISKPAILFIAVHPQLSYVGATMSGDSMAIMFITFTLVCMSVALDPENTSAKRVLFFFSGFLFTLCAISTKAIGFSIIPIVLVVGAISFLGYLKKKNIFSAPILFTGVALAGGALLLLSFFDFLGIILQVRYRLDLYISSLSWGGSSLLDPALFKNAVVLFMSFWLSYGWMVYKMSIASYLFLGGVTLALLLGVLKEARERSNDRKRRLLMLFGGYCILTLLFLTRVDPQGRYLLVATLAWAYFFSTGVQAFIPKRFQENSLSVIMSNMLLFNLLVVFGLLIPVFYFR